MHDCLNSDGKIEGKKFKHSLTHSLTRTALKSKEQASKQDSKIKWEYENKNRKKSEENEEKQRTTNEKVQQQHESSSYEYFKMAYIHGLGAHLPYSATVSAHKTVLSAFIRPFAHSAHTQTHAIPSGYLWIYAEMFTAFLSIPFSIAR